ncbi:MAG TPA: site-2 protease family protein [Myxococcota bacterium]|nr:site-2 protease family protein [Myxococcota bacterium]
MQAGSFWRLLADAVMVLIPMILSLTVHEFSHAFVAKRLGDNTAEAAGRLNLNPMNHADPFGTLLLPLLILMANGATGLGRIPFFGWAKPVPVNAGRFTRKITARTGNTLVAAAGPVSNLLLSLVCAALLSVAEHTALGASLAPPLKTLLIQMLFINGGLFVFNMIPIYPLDGEKVVAGFLSTSNAIAFERFNRQFGTWVLWGIIFFARDLIAYPAQLVVSGVLTVVGLS